MSTNSSGGLIDLIRNGANNPDEVVAKLVPSVWNNVEFSSSATPTLNAEVAYDPNGPPNPLMQWLKPTVILTGPAGRTVIAPYGQAGGGGGVVALGVLLGIVGVGFVLGRITK